jgi:hypothetical protein
MATPRWLSIQSTVGVARLVRDGDRLAAVPPPVLETLKGREHAAVVMAEKSESPAATAVVRNR